MPSHFSSIRCCCRNCTSALSHGRTVEPGGEGDLSVRISCLFTYATEVTKDKRKWKSRSSTKEMSRLNPPICLTMSVRTSKLDTQKPEKDSASDLTASRSIPMSSL